MAAHQVYREQLMANKHGIPVWFPEEPVYPGDVVYMYEGFFRRLFNIFHAITDNSDSDALYFPNGSPPNFEPWICEERWQWTRTGILSAGGICSRSVKKANLAIDATINPIGTSISAGAGVSFSCSRDQGAVLVMNDSADLEGVMHNKNLEDYMLRHHDNWHRLMTALQLHNYWDDVMLVTATIKTSPNWMVAAFVHKEDSQELKLGIQPAAGAGGSINFSFQDTHFQSVEHRQSTQLSKISEQGMAGPSQNSPLKDQCVFLKGYKFKYRIFKTLPRMKAAAGPENMRRHPDQEPGSAVSACESSDEDLILEQIPDTNRVSSPLDVILDYILENSSDDVKLALAHTDDVYALFDDDPNPSTFADDLKQLSPAVKSRGKIGMLEVHDAAEDAFPQLDYTPTGSLESDSTLFDIATEYNEAEYLGLKIWAEV